MYRKIQPITFSNIMRDSVCWEMISYEKFRVFSSLSERKTEKRCAGC